MPRTFEEAWWNPMGSDDTRWSSPTALYRYYDAAKRPMYVGITNQPLERDLTHLGGSIWRRHSAHVFYEVFPTRDLAQTAEAMAIHDERFEWNSHAPVRPRWVPRRDEWFCDDLAKLRGADSWWVTPLPRFLGLSTPVSDTEPEWLDPADVPTVPIPEIPDWL